MATFNLTTPIGTTQGDYLLAGNAGNLADEDFIDANGWMKDGNGDYVYLGWADPSGNGEGDPANPYNEEVLGGLGQDMLTNTPV